MPFNIGPGELLLVLIIALIVVGPGKLPDVGAAIGKSLREFRRAASDVNDATAVPPAGSPGQATSAAPPAAEPPAAPASTEQPITPASQEAAPVPGGTSGPSGGQGTPS